MCDVGKRIRDRRIELGYKAEELAPMVGLSPATIYRYENGDIKRVSINKIRPIATALKTTEAYLMGWTDDASLPESAAQEDDEIYELRETMRRNPEMRMLFSSARGAKKEHIEAAAAMLNALKRSDNGVE